MEITKQIGLDFKKRDVSYNNLETLTYAEMETKTYEEIENELYPVKSPKPVSLMLMEPIKEVRL